MRDLTRRIGPLIFAALSSILQIPRSVTAQSTAVTYQNPLAYVGADGNYYVTSLNGISATTITSNMPVVPYEETIEPIHYSSRPRWSPQGTKFAFVNAHRLYVVESRRASQQIVNDTISDNKGFAWSPDGKYIVYNSSSKSNFGLHIIESNGTFVRNLTLSDDPQEKFIGGGGGGDGPPPLEHAYRVFIDERDQVGESPFSVSDSPLYWTNEGFLFNSSLFPHMVLNSDTGVFIRNFKVLDNIIISPDNSRVLGNLFATKEDGTVIDENDQYAIQPFMIDLATGEELPIPLNIDNEPLAWTPDSKSIIFATKTDHNKIQDDTIYGFTGNYDYILTLWRQGLDEKKPTKLFEHEGYSFGVATVSPDNSAVVVSLITNSVFDQDSPESQIIAIPMNGGQAQWIAIGGKPAFGKGSFTAIPAEPDSALQPVQCPKSLSSHLKVGQRAKVTPGTPNMLRARPAQGADLKMMIAGSVFLVLDGPICGLDGLAWWKVNYNGVVGWTAESDNKSYWLEQ